MREEGFDSVPFAKGHGTGNDFVIVADPEGVLELTAPAVTALCDRHLGLGGDGLLRVVRTAAARELRGTSRPGRPEWFMDHRNADGSRPEMCGNGVRVFARYLVREGLADGPSVAILTRSGPVVVELAGDAAAVRMPMPRVAGRAVATLAGTAYPGTVVSCGNPNLVCRVADLTRLDLTAAIELDRVALPTGANVEFVTLVDATRVRVRVLERGVGETLSCGSGACAVAAAVLHELGRDAGTVRVDLPGGRLTVTIGDGRCVLAGPAVIVATGVLTPGAFGGARTGSAAGAGTAQTGAGRGG